MQNYLGIDIGGSSIKYGWGNSKLGLQHYGIHPFKAKTLGQFLSAAAAMFTTIESLHHMQDFTALGIATAGTISKANGHLVGVNPNLPFWVDQRPDVIIPQTFDNPVFSDNDANLMALAEAEGLKIDNLIGITVGSGIGWGIVSEGRIFRGSHGFAGEAGHAVSVENGAECTCGNRGCLEAYSSVDGIKRLLAQRSEHYLQYSLPELIEKQQQDAIVNEVITTGSRYLARAIANAVVLLDPEAVVLGGGAMDLGMYCLETMQAEIFNMLPKAHQMGFRLLPAHFGNRAGVMGAIVLCERNLT